MPGTQAVTGIGDCVIGSWIGWQDGYDAGVISQGHSAHTMREHRP